MKEGNYHNQSKGTSVARQPFSQTGILVLCSIAIGFLGYILFAVFKFAVVPIDQVVFDFISPHITESRTSLMQAFSFLGNHVFLVPANLLLIAYLLFRKKNNLSIRVAIIALSSLSIMSLLKRLFHRHRPAQPLVDGITNFSFPSGHAFMSVAFYGTLIWLVSISGIAKKWKYLITVILLLLILSIGFSRIYLRVHYTTDVLAGFCMGFIWLFFSIWLTGKANKERHYGL